MNNHHNSVGNSQGEKSQVDFKLLFPKLLRNWYWFVISVFICLIFSFLYLKYKAPIYTTSSKIILTKEKSESSTTEDAMAKALGGNLGTASNVEGEAEILKTRALMESVVRELKLNLSYFIEGEDKKIDLYDKTPFRLHLLDSPDSVATTAMEVQINGNKVHVYNETFDKTVNLYQAFVLPGVGRVQIEKGFGTPNPEVIYVVELNSIRESVSNYLGGLSVDIPIETVEILQLDFKNEVPGKSRDILNKLIQVYIEQNIIDKNKVADSTMAFIENRLLFVGQELGSIEGNVQTFRQKNKVTDISAQSNLLVTSTSESGDQLSKVETKLSVINSIEKYLTDANTNQSIVPSGALLEDPSFSVLVDGYNSILLEKERSSLSQTEGNPYMQNLNTQIASARSNMLASLRSLKNSLTISRQKIQSRSNAIAGQVREVPAIERTFLDLSRQQQIKQDLYLFLLQKREESGISKTSNISNCKVIEPPLSSVYPISPIGSNVYGYGLVLGLLIPFGSIFFKNQLNSRIESKSQIAGLTQVNVIGEIGHSDHSKDAIVIEEGSRSPIAEQFRSLRTNLSFFIKEEEKTILLTSSMSGEGKSFISLNLAMVLAMSGKKVVVMEMDLRKPNLSYKLKIDNVHGFTNYIISPAVTLESIIKPSGAHENLFVISSGNIPPNPVEMIMNNRTKELMATLSERFDYIIIDAPPIGMVTDAQLLSKFADLNLYIVRQGFTFKDQLEIPEEIYVNHKMKNIALLVNDVTKIAGYGYGYGYGTYGNEGESRKKSVFGRLFKG